MISYDILFEMYNIHLKNIQKKQIISTYITYTI